MRKSHPERLFFLHFGRAAIVFLLQVPLFHNLSVNLLMEERCQTHDMWPLKFLEIPLCAFQHVG